MGKTIIILFLLRISQFLSLKAYSSVIGNNYGVAGLHYLKRENQSNVVFSNSLTICLRFNYQKLNNRIIHIKGQKTIKSYISNQIDDLVIFNLFYACKQ